MRALRILGLAVVAVPVAWGGYLMWQLQRELGGLRPLWERVGEKARRAA